LGHFDPPSQKVQVDVRLDEVVLRAMARDPARRYQHAGDMKSDVESISQPVRRASWWKRKQVMRVQTVLRRLHSGPGDLRLAYLSAGTLGLAALLIGTGATSWGIFCVLCSFVFARATIAKSSIDGDFGPRQSLVYPTLILVYSFLLLTVFLWPLGCSLGATLPWADATKSTEIDLGAMGRFPLWGFTTYLTVTSTSLWWALLGMAIWGRPNLVRAVFRPFADRFQCRHCLLFSAASLLVFLAAVAAAGLALFGRM
jgi:hypothetical protein